MPVLSKFYRIVVRMLCVREFTAHFCAFYDTWELMAG